jgi:hypothetical protein
MSISSERRKEPYRLRADPDILTILGDALTNITMQR